MIATPDNSAKKGLVEVESSKTLSAEFQNKLSCSLSTLFSPNIHRAISYFLSMVATCTDPVAQIYRVTEPQNVQGWKAPLWVI